MRAIPRHATGPAAGVDWQPHDRLVVNLSLSAGRELVAIPGPSVVPDRVLPAHAPGDAQHLRAASCIDVSNEVIERLPGHRPHDGPAVRRRSPTVTARGRWRSQQHAVAGRQRARARVRALRRGLGGDGRLRRREDGGAARARPRRRSIPPRSRPTWRPTRPRRSRPCSSPTSTPGRRCATTSRPSAGRHRRRRPPGAADGRLHRLARLRALRDGRAGGRRHRRRLPEGPDGAARPGVRVGGPAGVGGPRHGRPAHRVLGLDRPGHGRARTTSATAARRRSRTCSACARR